jgi:hypothetical protein
LKAISFDLVRKKSKIKLLSQTYLKRAKSHAKRNAFYSTYSAEFNAE